MGGESILGEYPRGDARTSWATAVRGVRTGWNGRKGPERGDHPGDPEVGVCGSDPFEPTDEVDRIIGTDEVLIEFHLWRHLFIISFRSAFIRFPNEDRRYAKIARFSPETLMYRCRSYTSISNHRTTILIIIPRTATISCGFIENDSSQNGSTEATLLQLTVNRI
jgi:hypothetical protein